MTASDKITPADTMVEAIALTSPSGKMSKRARKAAEKRLHEMLFPDGLQLGTLPKQPTEAERLRRQAIELRGLANRGMKPRAYKKQAEELEAQADKLEGEA